MTATLAAFLFYIYPCWCQEESRGTAEYTYSESQTSPKDKESAIDVPVGMELRKIGGMNMIVPEGAQVRKRNSLVVMEEPEEYAARNIFEIKARMNKIEERQKALEKEIEELKEIARAKSEIASSANEKTTASSQ
ncbi:MAG: hypothetical protein JXB40_04370 [Candidatus Omnitrophica bacterium]|nr:hypothetical protein [Candidatus Omnitrophota bacterium]